MRILVTGGSGFVGQNVCRLLVSLGHDVWALVREESVPDAVLPTRVHRVVGDLRDEAALRRKLEIEPVDAVIHLAWITHPGSYRSSHLNLDSLSATLTLARVCHESGCGRFVGAGTCAEYDWSIPTHHELSTPCVPDSLYGACKHAAFLTLRALFQESSTSFAWARYNFLFGPDDQSERVVAAAIDAFRQGFDFPCATPDEVVDFLHVREAASATVSLLMSDVEGPVNVGSGEPISVGVLIDRLAQLIGGPGTRVSPTQRVDQAPRSITPSLARLWNEVGWRPSQDLDTTLVETVRDRRAPESRLPEPI